MKSKIGPQELRAKGAPIRGLPDVLPRREGNEVFALVKKADKGEFTARLEDDVIYKAYRLVTHRKGDHGNWLYEKMKLYFVPMDMVS